MTIDLAKIKSDAEIIASRCDMLLMTLPVGDVLGMLAEINDLREDAERFRYIERDAYSGMSRIYGDDWISVIDAAIAKERP